MTLHLPIATQRPFPRAADDAKGLSARDLAKDASEMWRARRWRIRPRIYRFGCSRADRDDPGQACSIHRAPAV